MRMLVLTVLILVILPVVACASPPAIVPSSKLVPASIPTPTPEPELNKYQIFLLNNPEASEGFTEDEYRLAEEHLRRTPEVMDDPEFYEAFNAKIKIEEDLLKNLGMYYPIGHNFEG